MINREWQEVKVLTYSNEVDEYGQQRQGEPTEENVDMVCKIFSQVNVTDPRYIDIDVIGLTKNHTISDKNEIVISENPFDIPEGTYIVKYVIPTSRLYQILLKKKCQ